MSEQLFEQDHEMEVRLPWPIICRLAVTARCSGVSIDRIVEQSLLEKIMKSGAGND